MSPKSKAQVEVIREKSKKKIARQALKLFATQGYESTSMSTLASKAKVSKGLIYNYFEGKEDLLKYTLTNLIDEAVKDFPKLDDPDALENLRALIDYTLGVIHKQPDYMRLLVKLSLNLGKYPYTEEVIAGKTDFYMKIVTQIFSDLGYAYPENEVYIFSMLMDGYSLQVLSMQKGAWIEKAHEAIYRKYGLL